MTNEVIVKQTVELQFKDPVYNHFVRNVSSISVVDNRIHVYYDFNSYLSASLNDILYYKVI
jgi:hypothetical protein